MIYVFEFMITLTLCFPLGKSPWVGDIGRCGIELVYCLILTLILGGMDSCRDFLIHTKPWENFSRLFRGHYVCEHPSLKRGGINAYYLKTGIPPTFEE
jgi:hypothetical protein